MNYLTKLWLESYKELSSYRLPIYKNKPGESTFREIKNGLIISELLHGYTKAMNIKIDGYTYASICIILSIGKAYIPSFKLIMTKPNEIKGKVYEIAPQFRLLTREEITLKGGNIVLANGKYLDTANNKVLDYDLTPPLRERVGLRLYLVVR